MENTYQIKDILQPAGSQYLATLAGGSIDSVLAKAKKLYPEAGLIQVNLVESLFDKRIADTTKTQLHHNFIVFIRHLSINTGKTEDYIFGLWKEYTNKCDSYDQSPTKAEFCQWYKLECAENILRLI